MCFLGHQSDVSTTFEKFFSFVLKVCWRRSTGSHLWDNTWPTFGRCFKAFTILSFALSLFFFTRESPAFAHFVQQVTEPNIHRSSLWGPCLELCGPIFHRYFFRMWFNLGQGWGEEPWNSKYNPPPPKLDVTVTPAGKWKIIWSTGFQAVRPKAESGLFESPCRHCRCYRCGYTPCVPWISLTALMQIQGPWKIYPACSRQRMRQFPRKILTLSGVVLQQNDALSRGIFPLFCSFQCVLAGTCCCSSGWCLASWSVSLHLPSWSCLCSSVTVSLDFPDLFSHLSSLLFSSKRRRSMTCSHCKKKKKKKNCAQILHPWLMTNDLWFARPHTMTGVFEKCDDHTGVTSACDLRRTARAPVTAVLVVVVQTPPLDHGSAASTLIRGLVVSGNKHLVGTSLWFTVHTVVYIWSCCLCVVFLQMWTSVK